MRKTVPPVKQLLLAGAKKPAALDKLKRKFAAKYGGGLIPNVELLRVYRRLAQKGRIKQNKKLELVLRKRKIRSLSGIVTVSVLTKPYPCPGKCLYCPTQKAVPKSYLRNEPAVMRAIANNFDPYNQVKMRLRSLETTGHPLDKIELIIIGGTWSYLPKQYQNWFIKRCFSAANEFGRRKPRCKTRSLETIQKENEKTKCRIIGITIETRPDFISEKEIRQLRKLGVTRVELGVQSIYDNVLKLNQRGHGVKETIRATKLLKDAGFKVCYHIMPNLPSTTLKADQKMFHALFTNPDFQPDLLKIYPCVVLKEAPGLYKMWRKGRYRPYTDQELINLLTAAKKEVPFYCRIARLIRDIPATEISAGSKISNLRQNLAAQLKKQGFSCCCIRCREIKGAYQKNIKLKLFRQDYNASGGKEIFLSFEDEKRKNLFALLRLRLPSQLFEKRKHFLPAVEQAAIIRELHTYGQLMPLVKSRVKKTASPQHKGLGLKLVKEAEKIAKKEFGLRKIAVIAGIGARDYYSRKAGYQLEDSYMTKQL